MAIKINEVVEVLQSKHIAAETLREIVIELNRKEDAKKQNAGPKSKKQYLFLASIDTGSNANGYVVQVAEDEDVAGTMDKVRVAAQKYNGTRKGSLYPVRSVVEALSIPRKFLVEEGVWIKTKEPVRTLTIPPTL